MLGCINYNPVPRGTGNRADEACQKFASLQIDSAVPSGSGDRVKRCLSEGPAPAAYSAVPKMR